MPSRTYLHTLVLLCLISRLCATDVAAQEPGIDVLDYLFEIHLADDTNRIQGETTVTVRFVDAGLTAFHLDLVGSGMSGTGMRVEKVMEAGRPVSFAHGRDRLRVLPAHPPEAGEERVYSISYSGVPADGLIISENKYGERTFFGDNWPNRARHWLPTVDHPSDKARVAFAVTAPERYQVVANGRLVEESDLPDGLRLTHWRSTAPLPTKVMVIGVAEFAVHYLDEVNATPVQSWVFPQDRAEGFRDFARAERILRFFERRLGPFPYEKLANVQSKTRYGGMENAGAIFYNEDAVTGSGDNEMLIAHEIAHQWFGDAVTETDWAHLWLSEGFATYLAHLYAENTYGRDALETRLLQDREVVLEYTATHPQRTLVDTTYTDPTTLLTPVAYQKGAWVLHMLRFVVGDDAFWEGLRTFYRRYRGGNADTEAFRSVMEEVSGLDLAWFFEQWAYRSGVPRYEGTWTYDKSSRQLVVTLDQVSPDDVIYRIPLQVAIYTENGTPPRIETVELDELRNTVTFALTSAPSRVVLDPNTWALVDAEFGPR